MAQSQNVNGKSIAILRSAVRGVHVYKRIPSLNSRVSLDLCGDSNVTKRYPKAITASLNGNILGHIAGEHSKIVYNWIKNNPNGARSVSSLRKRRKGKNCNPHANK